MNVETIREYQRWADREYVTPLTCKNHSYHRLVPVQTGGSVTLLCPRDDYHRELGKAEYLAIQRKVQMAEVLWKMNQ